MPQTKNNFYPYDLPIKDISSDRKLINKLYAQKFKQGDTITLNFDKGLFGIIFQTQPLIDK